MKVKYISLIFFILFANVALAKAKIYYNYEEIKASIPNFNNMNAIQKKDALITFYKQADINLDNRTHALAFNRAVHYFLEENLKFRNDNSAQPSSYNKKDYWANVNEFLSNGYGDCEDYAIFNYHLYQQLGMDPKRMALGYLKAKEGSSYPAHMILLIYNEDLSGSPRFVDNMQSGRAAAVRSYDDKTLANFKHFDATYAFFSKDRAFELDPKTAILLRPINIKPKVGILNPSQGIEAQDGETVVFDNIHSNLNKVFSDLMFLAKEGPTPLISKDDCL